MKPTEHSEKSQHASDTTSPSSTYTPGTEPANTSSAATPFSQDPLLNPATPHQPDQQPQPQHQPVPQPGQEDPGKVLGIFSIVLDVVGITLIGAILGYLSKKESRKAGFDGTLGNVGMIIGIVLAALSTLAFLAYVLFFVVLIGVSSTQDYDDSDTLRPGTTQIRGEF